MNKSILSTTGTIKYRLKEVKAKNETSIILDYSFGRNNRIKFATGYKVDPKHWDQQNQRIRAVSTIKNREKVNNDLLKYASDFSNAVTYLNEEEKQDKECLKTLLETIVRGGKTTQSQTISFFTFADDFTKKRDHLAKTINNLKLKPITVRAYKQTIKQLKDFDKSLKYSLDFDKFDLDFYYKFIKYLEEQNYSKNTIGKHIKNLKSLLNCATEEGYNSNLKYKHREFKVLSEESVSIYLTEEEITALYNADLSEMKNWELARDIFLIGYYTGQRVSDYRNIKKEQFKIFNGTEVIEFKQQKTEKKLYVPVHPKMKQILKKRYKGDLPPQMSAKDINKYIKKAGRKAKISAEVKIEKVIDGKRISVLVPKHELIMSHTSRRSFCTNAYLSKMPVIDIMAISGHTTEKEFYKYIKVTPQERAIKIANSAFFK